VGGGRVDDCEVGAVVSSPRTKKAKKPFRMVAWAVLTRKGVIPLAKKDAPIICVGRRRMDDYVWESGERVIKVEIREVK